MDFLFEKRLPVVLPWLGEWLQARSGGEPLGHELDVILEATNKAFMEEGV
jgi:hypothetical protein